MLLQDTPLPCLEGNTNLDLLLYAQDLELALTSANNDKAALRRYFEEAGKNE